MMKKFLTLSPIDAGEDMPFVDLDMFLPDADNKTLLLPNWYDEDATNTNI